MPQSDRYLPHDSSSSRDVPPAVELLMVRELNAMEGRITERLDSAHKEVLDRFKEGSSRFIKLEARTTVLEDFHLKDCPFLNEKKDAAKDETVALPGFGKAKYGFVAGLVVSAAGIGAAATFIAIHFLAK